MATPKIEHTLNIKLRIFGFVSIIDEHHTKANEFSLFLYTQCDFYFFCPSQLRQLVHIIIKFAVRVRERYCVQSQCVNRRKQNKHEKKTNEKVKISGKGNNNNGHLLE